MTSSLAPVRLTRLEAELILNGLLNGNTVERYALETDATRFTVENQVRAIRGKIRQAIAAPLPSQAGDIEQLGLSNRVYRALRRHGIGGVSDLRALSRKELSKIKGVGEMAVREIELILNTGEKSP